MMELTKYESKVMDPRYLQKCRWYLFYPGLALLAAGIIIVAYGYTRYVQKIAAAWDNNIVRVNNIAPDTKNEERMHDIALSALKAAKKGWVNFAEEKTRSTSMLLLLCGVFLVGFYRQAKRDKTLIEKIGASNKSP